ncbi:MAG: glycosyltransferase [Leptospirales bacterium]
MVDQKFQKISVCHILPALPAHGAEQLLVDLFRNFDRERFNLSVVLINEEGPLANEVRELGIPVFLIRRTSRFDLSIIGKIRRHILENKIDIVHTHIITADLWGRISLLGTKIPLVTTSHSIHFNSGRLQGALDHFLSHVTDAIVCVSSRVRDSRKNESRLPFHRLVVIENGIDFNRLETPVTRPMARESLGLGEEIFTLGIIGRLSLVKNHKLLLQSIAEICQGGRAHPNLQLLVVGEGELDVLLKEEVRKSGIEKNVRFLGLRRDIPVILKALDLLAIPSTREGLPIVLLEAMKARIPVIASNVGGIPDVIDHGKTGILIKPERDPLSKAIVQLMEDSSLRDRMGTAAEKFVAQKFNVCQTAWSYSRLYRSLIFQKRLSSPQRLIMKTLANFSLFLPKTREKTPFPTLRVLMYHRISDSIEPDILNTHPTMFARQMEWLKEERYNILSATDAMSGLFTGSLKTDSVLVTFDDGYRDNFTEAYPVLKRMGLPALVFPTSDFVLGASKHPRYKNWKEEVEYLSPDQIREMSSNGIDFGSHGKTHTHFPTLSADMAEGELRESKECLEQWTGKQISLCAYPNGLYGPEHFPLLEKTGFKGAFTTNAGANTTKTHSFELCRTEISGRDSLQDFSFKLQGKYDAFHRIYQNSRKWLGKK